MYPSPERCMVSVSLKSLGLSKDPKDAQRRPSCFPDVQTSASHSPNATHPQGRGFFKEFSTGLRVIHVKGYFGSLAQLALESQQLHRPYQNAASGTAASLQLFSSSAPALSGTQVSASLPLSLIKSLSPFPGRRNSLRMRSRMISPFSAKT
ncbi:hypothetical protein K443DRAFT_448805 [Laccaria amethystina LaAM-08-1]|uniref:Uncharacterized protein n=1 Tax=Laccaria amethystina LaAM-08-1 TaxID=1095629 RepID=A0A0C9YFI9_9AGAR|nr:hypothetical protein K443DRAFT_448805 [Laccaria amethystina LaAM-08-1]